MVNEMSHASYEKHDARKIEVGSIPTKANSPFFEGVTLIAMAIARQ